MSKEQVILLENLDAKNLPELQGLKESQLKIVDENPFIEIVDNKSYEEAKKRRTALLKGRTSLEAQEKVIASKLTAFRKQVGTVTLELIEITKPHEDKQQEEVKRYEAIKEAERAEKERLENERIERIQNKIKSIESECYSLISNTTFQTIETTKKEVDSILNSEYDFEEFDIFLEQVKRRVENQFEIKISELQEKESQRIENERLAKEKAEADAKLRAIEEEQRKEREERLAKEQDEKKKGFQIRITRLQELDSSFDFKGLEFSFYGYSLEKIYNADVIDFENIYNDVKKLMKEESEKKAKEDAENKAREKAEIEAKKKADKENKERQKRLKTDKAIIKNGLEIYFADLDLFTENVETKEFIENANNVIQDLKNQLLTELENL